ncbi:MAG: prepilin-type N-terminal cleavage/methylation domain-containing protein [Desulfobacteraceae bacterium]|nr:MAG: prepilin-type N-terminal cleavage/methylation domain-containing protein [Desulfobacteraceae bacterium]
MRTLRFIEGRKTRSRSGFTLVELLTVIAIFGIVALFGAPAIHSHLQRQGLGNAKERLRSDLQQAKLLAIKNAGFCDIDFNTPAANQYRITLRENDLTLTRVIGVVDLADYRGSVTFTTDPGTGDPTAGQIRFNGQGLIDGPAGAAFLTNADNADGFRRVRASLSGAVSEHVWSAAVNAWVTSGGGWR